jgi:aminopeptidase N
VQSAPAAWPTLRSHRLAIGLYDRTDAGLVRRDRVELDVLGARTEVPQLVGVAQPDLVLVNDDDLTYAKVRLDPRSLATLTGSIGEFTDRLARSLCWSAAWDMTRDAEMSTQDYVTLVLGGVGRETDSSVVRTLLRQAETAVILYADPTTRDATMRRLADGLLELLRAAVPGSDSQLQITRAFASAAASDAQLAIVRAVLDGTELLDGLTIDTDLRWHLLHQLVAAGKADELEVDRELDADDTATGRRQAAAALAARPDAAAKAEAWSAAVTGDELPNAIQTAMIGGFSQSGQLDLLRPYVSRTSTPSRRCGRSGPTRPRQNIVIGLFPTLLAEQATVDAADTWLQAHQDAAPALRRLVGESRDGVARALRAQARDARP